MPQSKPDCKHCWHDSMFRRHGDYSPGASRFEKSETLISSCCWCGEQREVDATK